MTVPWSKQLEGKYEIVEKLAEGGMGTVYKVRHRLLDELLVVKTIRASLSEDKELQSRFLQEARLASRLRHPNIAQLFDFSIAKDGTAFIVMEFIHGISLDHLLNANGPLDVGVTLELAIQSLAAIGFLHRHNYIHRDVSPDNLMLTRDVDRAPTVKLIDLGIAKGLGEGSRLTVTGMFLGKLRYSSPEHLDEGTAGDLDGRSDIYSFGVVLYELLTGRLPFDANSPKVLMAGHLLRPPAPFDVTDPTGRVPQELRRVILRALSKDRESRFRDTTELASELQALLRRFPASPQEMERIMATAAHPAVKEVGNRDGKTSAQARLDRQFASEPTPLPTATADKTTIHLEASAGVEAASAEIAVLVEVARNLFEQGEPQAAGRQIDAILALRPDHAEALELSKSILRQKLETELTRALATDDLETAEKLLEEAQKGTSADRFDDLWEKLRKAQQRRAEELFDRAERALQQDHLEQADELVSEALALGGDPVRSRKLRQTVDELLAKKQERADLLAAFETAMAASRAEDARQFFDRIAAELGAEVLPEDAAERLARLELAARQRLVETLIESGEIGKALAVLDETEADLGGAGRLSELRATAHALQDQIEAVESAFSRRDLEKVDAVLERLHQATGGAVAAASFEARRRQLAKEIEQVRAIETRRQELAGALAEAERELDGGDLDAVAAHLERAEELMDDGYGETSRDRLTELRRRANRRRIESEVEAGLALAAEGRFDQAHARLDDASELARSDGVALAAVTKARATVEESEQLEALDFARQEIVRLLDSGELTAAGMRLRKLSERTPGDPELAALRTDLDRRLQAREEARREAERQPIALPEEGRKTEERVPESPNAEAEKPPGKKPRTRVTLLRSVGKVAAALEARDAVRARALLEEAEALWGQGKALEAAWQRLALLERGE
jgi:serine/threonine protein kinase